MRGHINRVNDEAVLRSYVERYMDDFYQGVLTEKKVVRLIGKRTGCGHEVSQALFNRAKAIREKNLKLYGDWRW